MVRGHGVTDCVAKLTGTMTSVKSMVAFLHQIHQLVSSNAGQRRWIIHTWSNPGFAEQQRRSLLLICISVLLTPLHPSVVSGVTTRMLRMPITSPVPTF